MLPAQTLRPLRSRPPDESGLRRFGPSRNDKAPLRPHRYPGACKDGKKLFRGLSIQGTPVRLTFGGTFMQYMLLIYLDEQALSEAEREQCYQESAEYAHVLNSSGQYLTCAPLYS